MRKFLLGLLVGCMAASGAATASTRWTDSTPYTALVRCERMAENSAVDLQLVTYERLADGTLKLVYRCR